MISIISTEFLTLRLSSIYSSRRVVIPNGCEQGMTESAFFQQSAEAEPNSAMEGSVLDYRLQKLKKLSFPGCEVVISSAGLLDNMIKLSRISWRKKKLIQKCINIVNNTYNNQKIHTYKYGIPVVQFSY